MSPELVNLLIVAGYVVLGRLVVKSLRGEGRDILFALLNVGVFYWLFFSGTDHRYLPTFLAYLALVFLQYAMLRFLAEKGGWKTWLTFSVPILALILAHYVPGIAYENVTLINGPYLVGISYLAFRTSQLVLDVRNHAVQMPGFFDYLGYCFFVPIMSVGPINPYGTYRNGFAADAPAIPIPRAALRILVGMVEYKIFGSLLFQLTYIPFLLDGQYHPWIDLPIAAACYTLYLYCNFSGFCDMAIGCAGLIGIPVAENFNYPFGARNLREFWNRWHMTLSLYMRDILFSPLSKYLAGLFGPANVNHAIALSIMIVFILIGIWHGAGLHYAIFGFLQGVGVVSTHYYTIWLKKRLGRDGFKAYNANPWIMNAGRVITFCYFAFTLFFFANSMRDIEKILSMMR
jgi:D-alanyl-lipoteichoic acid acyltransferase DltB (MBOAT superfamily)